MAIYSPIMKQRNDANTGWDSILPITLAENVLVDESGNTVASELAKITATIDTLSSYTQKMLNGESVVIDCYGDSTYWGQVSGSNPIERVSEPPVLTLQKVLRSYYNNDNIVCNNYGEPGAKTSDIIAGFQGISSYFTAWDTRIAATENHVIFICFGINDGADYGYGITPEQYRTNLRHMVKTARANNNFVILETPNVILNKGDNMARIETLKQYVAIMKDVSKEYTTPLLDNFTFTEEYLYSIPNKAYTMPDSYHPSVDLYRIKGIQMTSPFIKGANVKVDVDGVIPCFDNAFKYYGEGALQQVASWYKYSYGIFGQSIKVAFNTDASGHNLYLADFAYTGASPNYDIVLDGKTIFIGLSAYEPNYSSYFPADMEKLIAKNLYKGFHILEVIDKDASGSTTVNCSYIKLKRSLKVNNLPASNLNFKNSTIHIDSLRFTLSDTTQFYALTDIATSRILSDIDVEMTMTLHDGEGFYVMGGKSTNNSIVGGVMVLFSGLNINILENAVGNDYSSTTISTNNSAYINSSHVYRLVVTTSGIATLYIDDVSVGTYSLTRNLKGGYLGFFKLTAGTMKIKDINIYE